MGVIEKTFKINGRSLILSEINSEKDPSFFQTQEFLQKFYNSEDYIEISTSGSTGRPKVIRIKKDYLIASAQRTIDFLQLKKGARALVCLPTNKIAGLMMLTRWLVGEMDLVLVKPSSSPLAEVEGEFDFAAMIPLQALNCLDQIERVNKLIIGGGVIEEGLELALSQKSKEYYHTYGMTETISHVAMRKIGQDSDFKALNDVEFSVDGDSRLIIDAPPIGVHKLKTNDVVQLIDARTFVWKGRYDNVVNSGGVKLFPEEIESKIGAVGQAYFLIGLKDEALGEKLVLLTEGPINEALKQKIESLDRFEKPRLLLSLNKFMRTETNKIRRKECLDKALEQ